MSQGVTRMFETTCGHEPHGIRGAAGLREPRSGQSGFGGRPSLHPAWRDEDVREIDAQIVAIPTSAARQDDGLPIRAGGV